MRVQTSKRPPLGEITAAPSIHLHMDNSSCFLLFNIDLNFLFFYLKPCTSVQDEKIDESDNCTPVDDPPSTSGLEKESPVEIVKKAGLQNPEVQYLNYMHHLSYVLSSHQNTYKTTYLWVAPSGVLHNIPS